MTHNQPNTIADVYNALPDLRDTLWRLAESGRLTLDNTASTDQTGADYANAAARLLDQAQNLIAAIRTHPAA